jgi:hypothetical protein
MSKPAEKTIIREYRSEYPSTITCYDSKDSVTFVYSRSNMQATEITMKGYWVNDFLIYGDIVYFCGKTTKGSLGIIGFFNIQDVFINNGNITVLPHLYAGEDVYTVYELTRITAFPRANNTIHIACIGTCEIKNNYPCLIDFDTDTNTPTYIGGYVEKREESFTDVRVVKNQYLEPYLVTAGFDTSYGRYINIRVYDPNDVFALSGIQDKCHIYCIDTASARPWRDDGVLLTDINNGNFLTVSYREAPEEQYRDSVAVKDNTNIHIGIFCLSDIINNSVYAMLDNHEIPIGLTAKREMDDMVYNNSSESVVFLHSYYTLTEKTSDFCEFNPTWLGNSGTILAFHNNGIKQQGLSIYNNLNNYILSGFKISFPTELNYEMETFGTNPQCVGAKEYNYERVRKIDSMNPIKAFNSSGFIPEKIYPTLERIDFPIYIDCEN